MRIRPLCTLSVASALLTGCVSDELDVGSSASSLLLADGAALWPHTGTSPTLINLCFTQAARSKPGFTSIAGFTPRAGEGPGYRDWIVDAIQESWGRALNLRLQFWDACPNNDNPPAGWVVIHFNEGGSDRADVGYQSTRANQLWLNQNQGQGQPPSSFDHHACGFDAGQPRPATGSDPYDSLEELRADAMHEFGHTLGFAHNKVDPDRPGGLLCTNSPDASDDLNPGEFDFGSVMDYCTAPCNVDMWGDNRPYFRVRLSDWDILNAQQLYGTKYTTGGQYVVGHRNTVVEVPASNTVAGQLLEVWDYKGGGNERWSTLKTANRIFTPGANLVWDVVGGTTNPNGGTAIQLYPPLNQANQAFAMIGVEWRGTGDNCLAALSASSGAKVELRRCNGSSLQRWNVSYGNSINTFKLAGTNLCVATPTTSPANGTQVALESCSTAGARSSFQSSAGRLVIGGKCLDTDTGSPAGAVISTGSAGRSLDTYDANFFPTRQGRRLQLFSCKASQPSNLNQQFYLRGPITGLNNQCLDIAGGLGKNGARVQLHPCTGNPNQVWDAYVF